MVHWFRSIRVKLTLWYSFVLLVTLVTCGIVAYLYSSEQLSQSLDQSLSSEVVWIRNIVRLERNRAGAPKKRPLPNKSSLQMQITLAPSRPPDTDNVDSTNRIWSQIYGHLVLNPNKTMFEVWDSIGGSKPRSSAVLEPSLVLGHFPVDSVILWTVTTEDGADVRVASVGTRDRMEIYVAYPLDELEEALSNLFSIFRVLIPIAVGVSLVIGWLLAYKSLKPVDDITRAANEITAQNLDHRISGGGVDDEIGRLTATINGMIGRLHDSFEQIKQFSIDASHELRTPLTIMRGEVEHALRNPKSPEEYREVLSSTLEEVVGLSAIVDDLLTLSKADLKQHVVVRDRINLKDFIAELYEDSTIIAEKKRISVVLQKNEEVVIVGDKMHLRRLFLNLVDNAIKYTPEKGGLILSSERQNGFAKVAVSDTGIGISAEDQRNIFNRFYRADRARSGEVSGSGLGLSISKLIAELHGGKIEVKSQPGSGSTFTVYLPL